MNVGLGFNLCFPVYLCVGVHITFDLFEIQFPGWKGGGNIDFLTGCIQ